MLDPDRDAELEDEIAEVGNYLGACSAWRTAQVGGRDIR